ncbi:MAG: exodeoxyribonuclease VII small subunit [Chlamydiales bacterium]|nr:exodeoxyribonuclease VII small subunit [Chlamydiales bacterium]
MTDSSKDNPKSDEVCFEKAFARLETILERMNAGESSLDESLKLFEEADGLIIGCNKRLCDAERRVETLIKNRNGELALGADQKPATTDFTAES